MKEYNKPVVEVVDEKAEGVFAASGDNEREGGDVVCRYGRKQASDGIDTCQACSATDGRESTGSYYKKDYKGCPDGMPEK
ncbi:MAG: hypothetical protein ACI4EJ_10220 [Bacteroides sp.]